MYYMRKISRGKWPEESRIAQATLEDIQADTVTNELKTDQNTLSLWEANNPEEIDDVFVALASNLDSIGTMCIVKIDEERLRGFTIDNQLGDTPAIEINAKHHNVTGLNYVNMGRVIQEIVGSLADNGLERRTKGQMRKLLVDAYKKGKLDMDKISEKLRDEIYKQSAC